jgi:hypothetical protein
MGNNPRTPSSSVDAELGGVARQNSYVRVLVVEIELGRPGVDFPVVTYLVAGQQSQAGRFGPGFRLHFSNETLRHRVDTLEGRVQFLFYQLPLSSPDS